MAPLMNNQPMGVLGVSVCNDEEDWQYFIAVSSSAEIDNSLAGIISSVLNGAFKKH